MFVTIEASIGTWNRSPLVTPTPLAVWISVIPSGTLVTLPTGEPFLAVALPRLTVARLPNRSRNVALTVLTAALKHVAPGIRHT